MTQISAGEAFPSIRAAIGAIPELSWETAFHVSDDSHILAIARAIRFVQLQSIQSGVMYLLQFSKSALRDISNLRAGVTGNRERRALDFLRLFLCLIPMEATLTAGDKSRSYDWTLYGISVDYDPNIRVSTGYAFLPVFEAGDSRIGLWCFAEINRWTYVFFTLARTLGGLDEIATKFHPYCWSICRDSFDKQPTDRTLAALAAIAAYLNSANKGPLEEMALHFKSLWESPRFPRQLRGDLGIMLTTSLARFSGRHHSEWAAIVISQYKDVLVEHQLLQFLCIATNTRRLWHKNRAEILGEIRRFSREVRDWATNIGAVPMLALEERNDVIHPLIHFLIGEGLLDDLLDVIATWYEKSPARRCSSDVLFIAPTHGNGMAVVWPGGRFCWTPKAGTAALEKLLADTSRALGEFYRATGSEVVPITAEDRDGVPVYERGMALEISMEEHYEPKRVSNLLSPNFGPSSLVIFPHLPGPVQAVFSRAGISAPLQTSYLMPAEERRPSVISIWTGETFLTEFEFQAIEAVCSVNGWRLRRTGPTGNAVADRQAFKNFYEDAEPDVLWVVGHGRFVSYKPEQSGFHIDDENTITPLEVDTFTVPGRGRRLLVLNTCSGATAQLTGGSARLGLAQEATGPKQAVIAHLWPVDPLLSLAFGAALVSALTAPCYFTAFQTAVSLLRRPDDLMGFLRDNLGDAHPAISRVQQRSHEFANILNWGSPVFLT